MRRPKALIAWSSGKDSAWSQHEARCSGAYDVVGALTFGSVGMHGVREEILRAQRAAVARRAYSVSVSK